MYTTHVHCKDVYNVYNTRTFVYIVYNVYNTRTLYTTHVHCIQCIQHTMDVYIVYNTRTTCINKLLLYMYTHLLVDCWVFCRGIGVCRVNWSMPSVVLYTSWQYLCVVVLYVNWSMPSVVLYELEYAE